MKRLINQHKEEVEKYMPHLDIESVNQITYLYEFDRAVQ